MTLPFSKPRQAQPEADNMDLRDDALLKTNNRTAVYMLGIALVAGAAWASLKSDVAGHSAQITDLIHKREEDHDVLTKMAANVEYLTIEHRHAVQPQPNGGSH